jgi:hypothetical protein
VYFPKYLQQQTMFRTLVVPKTETQFLRRSVFFLSHTVLDIIENKIYCGVLSHDPRTASFISIKFKIWG